jgi:amino acid adenylation domain-containing protein
MTPGFAGVRPESSPQGLPPSFAQQRFWFLDQLAPGDPSANLVFAHRLSGALDVPALRDAFTEVVARHEALRTRVVTTADGPRQVIDPASVVAVAVQDVSAVADPVTQARGLAEAEFRILFDLPTGPLLRVQLFRLGDDDHVLVMAVHHIAVDGWSMGVLESELSVLYRAFADGQPSPLAPLDIQYVDFAQWQRSLLSDEVVEALIGYWRERLRGMPDALELPADRPRSPTPTYTADVVSFDIPRDVAVRLRALAAERRASLCMLLLTAFDVLLVGYTGGQDIVVTVPDAARDRAEYDDLIGCFVNNLVLRVDCQGDPTIEELLDRVRETVLGALEHRDLPFERLVEDLRPSRDPGKIPLAQVGFQLLSPPHMSGSLDLAGLAVAPFEIAGGTAHFDLEVSCFDHGPDGPLLVRVVYAADLFTRSMMERFAGHFGNILAGVRPDVRLSRLLLLTGEQARQQLVEWNATAADLPAMTVTQMFESHAARAPRSIAVSSGDEKLTYGDLDARANRFAHRLRSHGIGPEMVVGLHMRRGLNVMIAILAVFKAGAAYLPLDPEYPADRIAYLLADASCSFVITEDSSALDATMLGEATAVIGIDSSADSAFPATPQVAGAFEDLAYVIYTSGSTGRPKGVEVAHGSVANMAAFHARSQGIGPRSRVLQVTSLSGDISVSDICGTWAGGGELVIAPEHSIGDDLASVLAERRITQVTMASSLLATLPEVALPDLATIQFGADVCAPAVASRWAPGRTLINGYGPTEATVYVSSFLYDDEVSGPLPIGRPVANSQLYILDRFLRPVPVGVTGEIYIGGVLLARGYRGNPALTASCFVANPFAADGSRLYRTGDLARFLPDGNIDFLGRFDDQVKLRGFRIELGEIESVIAEHPAVAQATVVVRGERLFGYVVPAGSDSDGIAELMREHLQDTRERFDTEHREGRTAQPPNPTAVERIAALRPQRLLEIGCGAGTLLRELLPACERYVATDFSPVAINRLRSEFAGKSGLMLLAREATDFRGFHDGSFDAVVIDSLLRHLPGLPTADEVIWRAVSALADSGTLIVTDMPKHGDNELTIDPAYFSSLPDRIARVAEVMLIDREDGYDVLVTVGAPRPLAEEPAGIPSGLANDPLRAKRAKRLSREIRDLAQRRLPSHMVPAGIAIIDVLPLSPNGKVNVRQLPAPIARSEGRAPRGSEEEAMCALFAEILELEAVSPDDGFFDLGGHSLLAFRLRKLIQSRLGVDITLETIFREPTPAALAAYLNPPIPGEKQ